MAERPEIASLLRTFKACVMLGRFEIRSRQKNRQALLDLDLSPERRREVLLGLEPEDYLAGPKPDYTDPTKDVWEFGKIVDDQDVYIKLRVVEDRKQKDTHWAFLWSFHPAERPLKYPLRGGGS